MKLIASLCFNLLIAVFTSTAAFAGIAGQICSKLAQDYRDATHLDIYFGESQTLNLNCNYISGGPLVIYMNPELNFREGSQLEEFKPLKIESRKALLHKTDTGAITLELGLGTNSDEKIQAVSNLKEDKNPYRTEFTNIQGNFPVERAKLYAKQSQDNRIFFQVESLIPDEIVNLMLRTPLQGNSNKMVAVSSAELGIWECRIQN